ncbi:hypothetical protein [Symbiopectobacterium purcellii]|uniref:hypothetical protein n=1 Tax=Symbiopectobacterium purcellii TaxID=2871826 RepID=UPI003F82DF5D
MEIMVTMIAQMSVLALNSLIGYGQFKNCEARWKRPVWGIFGCFNAASIVAVLIEGVLKVIQHG